MKTIEDLLPSLVARTAAGDISWNTRIAPLSGYETRLAKYKLAVWEWVDQDTEAEGVTIAILDANNTQIDYMAVDQYASRHAKFLEAFQTARRSALGLDKVIDEIAAALEDPIPF